MCHRDTHFTEGTSDSEPKKLLQNLPPSCNPRHPFSNFSSHVKDAPVIISEFLCALEIRILQKERAILSQKSCFRICPHRATQGARFRISPLTVKLRSS